jgi:hypothetical protein
LIALVFAVLLSAAPERVEIGVFLRNADGLDFRNNSYTLSLTLWMRWSGAIDPTKSFQLTNGIEMWGLQVTPAFPEPRVLDGGARYQRFNIEGRFFHKFWLGNFPLDWQKLVVEVEDAVHPASELVYVADEVGSRTIDGLVIPGWDIAETYNVAEVIDHGTAFGDKEASYSHYRYGLKIMRTPSYFWLKVMPPILILLVSCFFVLRLRAQWVDARTGTIVIALLTQVFLQQQFIMLLPGVGMQMLLDQIFNLSYATMALLLIESIVVARWWDIAARLDEQHVHAVRLQPDRGDEYAEVALPGEKIRQRIERLDRLCFFGAPLAYVLLSLIVVWIMRGGAMFG